MIKPLLISLVSNILGKYNHIPIRRLRSRRDRLTALSLYARLLDVSVLYNLIEVGDGKDGSYFIPAEARELQVLISPGIGQTMTFELQLLNSVEHIYMIDRESPFNLDNHPNITYIPKYLVPQGLADADDISLPEILDLCSGKSIILQMDIEGSEWNILADLNSFYLQKISCIAIELHGLSMMWNYYSGYLMQKTLTKLLHYFNVAHVMPNIAGSFFYSEGLLLPELLEVTFVNKTICSSWEVQNNIKTLGELRTDYSPSQLYSLLKAIYSNG